MLFVIEEIVHFENILLVAVAILIDVPKELDLIDGLVHVILVVLDDLHANHLLRLNVEHLDCLREGGRAEVLKNLVPSGNN